MANTTITVSISDTDEKILKNDLLNIQTWLEEALQGKINNCWGRMREEWTQRLMNDESFTDPIPSNKDDFIALITSLPEYKNREDRESDANLNNNN